MLWVVSIIWCLRCPSHGHLKCSFKWKEGRLAIILGLSRGYFCRVVPGVIGCHTAGNFVLRLMGAKEYSSGVHSGRTLGPAQEKP